jgi:hypothetical protein
MRGVMDAAWLVHVLNGVDRVDGVDGVVSAGVVVGVSARLVVVGVVVGRVVEA